MSLKVSRRNFMKLSAAAALAVAGSSLLTGCSDPNKPTRNGDGVISIVSSEVNVTHKGNVFTVKVKNGRQNELVINEDSFYIETASGKTISHKIDKAYWKLSKGQEAVITVTAVEELPKNEAYTFYFRPDFNWTPIYAGWIYGKTEK